MERWALDDYYDHDLFNLNVLLSASDGSAFNYMHCSCLADDGPARFDTLIHSTTFAPSETRPRHSTRLRDRRGLDGEYGWRILVNVYLLAMIRLVLALI